MNGPPIILIFGKARIMSISCPQEFVKFSNALADIAGPIVLNHFRKNIPVDIKSDQTPVSVADRNAEAAMRQLISETYPDHGILGEEQGVDNPKAEYLWVIDPIDGTKSYLAGKPMFGTLIGLAHHGRPILGIIDQPFLKERWQGAIGYKTVYNNSETTTRTCPDLAKATLNSTSPKMFSKTEYRKFLKLSEQVLMTMYGGDCYAYGLLANGYIDLIIEADLKPYDFCALVPIVIGAGGAITDWQGKAIDINSDGRVIASGDPKLISQATKILTG